MTDEQGRARIDVLNAAIDHGLASGVVEDFSWADVKQRGWTLAEEMGCDETATDEQEPQGGTQTEVR